MPPSPSFQSPKNIAANPTIVFPKHLAFFLEQNRNKSGAILSCLKLVLRVYAVRISEEDDDFPSMESVTSLSKIDTIYQSKTEKMGNCIEIGLPALLLVIGLSQYLKQVKPLRDFPIFERFPVLVCVTVIWVYSLILTASGAYRNRATVTQHSFRTDRANLISTAPWFKFPYPIQWGPPTFAVGHAFAMMSAVLVSMVESTGAYKAASRMAIATPPPAYVLSRGIG